MVFTRQSKQAMSQWKGRIQTSRQMSSNALKLLFKNWFSIHLVLHRLYRWIISLTKYMIASLLSLMFSINLNLIYNVYPAWIFSVHCVKEVDWKSTLKLEFQSYVFDDLRNKLVSAHCTVTSNVLNVTDENHKRCIFPILPVNVQQSYHLRSHQTIILHTIDKSISFYTQPENLISITKRKKQHLKERNQFLYKIFINITAILLTNLSTNA